MHVEYRYFFPNATGIPKLLEKYVDVFPNGAALVRLSPTSEFGDWSIVTREFWKLLKSPQGRRCIPPFSASVVFGAEGHLFKKPDFKNSDFFQLETMRQMGSEMEFIGNFGCEICGGIKQPRNIPKIDERTVLNWDFGFSNYGRFIVHISKFIELARANVTGFKASPVECLWPTDYFGLIWSGSQNDIKLFLEGLTFRIQDELVVESWGKSTCLKIPPGNFEHPSLKKLLACLNKAHQDEELSFQVIPPASQFGKLPTCRWVELQITGHGGKESTSTLYFEEGVCPGCGQQGFCPKGPLEIDVSKWDGSDFFLTDRGRICLTKKAVQILGKDSVSFVEPARITK